MVLLATVVACGGGASGPAPVRIGSLIPVSGLGLSHYVAAFRAAARDVNAHGGVRGRPVEIDLCDDRNDPNQAQVCARQLVADGVIATAANVSQFSMVEGPILDEAGIPEVGGEALNPEDSTLPTEFPLDGGIVDQLAGGVVGMLRRGLRSLLVVAVDTPAERQLAQLAGQLVRATGGLSSTAFVPLAASDLTSYVQAAMQARTDVVFIALPPSMTVPFLVASKRAGARYVVMVPHGELRPRDIVTMGGRDALTENDIQFSGLPPLSASDRFPALRQFLADMDAELAAGDRNAAPELRNSGVVSVWLSVLIIAREASTLATVDAAHLLRALRTRPTVDTMGLTPPWTPGLTGPSLLPRMTNLSGYLVTQRDGVDVLVDPTPLNPFEVLHLSG